MPLVQSMLSVEADLFNIAAPPVHREVVVIIALLTVLTTVARRVAAIVSRLSLVKQNRNRFLNLWALAGLWMV